MSQIIRTLVLLLLICSPVYAKGGSSSGSQSRASVTSSNVKPLKTTNRPAKKSETKTKTLKKALANPEPSTHGP
jgi:hypothetical protein